MKRRQFLRTSLLGAGALAVAKATDLAPTWAAAAATSDSRIEVLPAEPLGTISPDIYGHFTEHLGGVIYDGIWVGKNSKVANIDGIRRELVEQMRKIKAPVVRYPGGCFADSYDWRDGVGPVDKRPRRTNFWANADNAQSPASHKYEPNEFGTNEFVQFCKLIGGQPYLAANVRSLPAEQFYQWVEYCNSPAGSTTLADLRAAAGYRDPFNVRFWGVGNESWGCGGDFTPQEYGVEFRRYTTWAPEYGQELSFIASGPNDDNWDWTRGLFEEIARKSPFQFRRIYGLALHYYSWNLSRGRTRDWNKGKGDAVQFDPVDWYELLRQGDVMESLINGHWQVMGELDKEHHVKLVVDEWGPWYKPGSEATPGDILEQMPTLRDAVFSGMTLDTFNRHPEKVAMAACAQLINCLNSLYLAHEDKFVVTPVGHVFGMYAGHQGGQALRAIFSAPQVSYQRDGQPASFWGLQGSASLKGKELFLTVVNPAVSAPREAEIVIRGASARSASATVLTAADIHAHNTFDQPQALVPQTREVTDVRAFTFPPASVTALRISLA
ncbi:MAG TPA: alpha-L-arabinofuranosidase C-terminal domain-containing protein [Terriglobales bacterium]|nr:alpha-L-arabinofuranosidase C-terminal domain-containing protein [Terriglobales bacterium]